jgi:hypothetical protein
MSEDPSGNTAQFQAFAQRSEVEPTKRSALPLVLGIGVVIIVVATVVAFIALG